jgi:hypothetical protein
MSVVTAKLSTFFATYRMPYKLAEFDALHPAKRLAYLGSFKFLDRPNEFIRIAV